MFADFHQAHPVYIFLAGNHPVHEPLDETAGGPQERDYEGDGPGLHDYEIDAQHVLEPSCGGVKALEARHRCEQGGADMEGSFPELQRQVVITVRIEGQYDAGAEGGRKREDLQRLPGEGIDRRAGHGEGENGVGGDDDNHRRIHKPKRPVERSKEEFVLPATTACDGDAREGRAYKAGDEEVAQVWYEVAQVSGDEGGFAVCDFQYLSGPCEYAGAPGEQPGAVGVKEKYNGRQKEDHRQIKERQGGIRRQGEQGGTQATGGGCPVVESAAGT